tara:strand:+ start:3753 stop:6710 length:2958 start_codon:yes stop_codon:yes gene_type:complete
MADESGGEVVTTQPVETPSQDTSIPMEEVGTGGSNPGSKKQYEREADPDLLTVNKWVGDVQRNILDFYDNPAYTLKLYMIPPKTGGSTDSGILDDASGEDARSDLTPQKESQLGGGGFLNGKMTADPKDTVVLAQTSVTGNGIDELEIITSIGAGGRNVKKTANFTITQPGAVDFPDQIMRAKNYLGIPYNSKDFPMFLEINFKGRKHEDNYEVSTEPVTINDKPYIYKIVAQNFRVNVTPEGSQYDFTTAIADDLAYNDRYYRLPRDTTTRGDTISKHIDQLEKRLNEYHKNDVKHDGNHDKIKIDLSGLIKSKASSNSGISQDLLIQDEVLETDKSIDTLNDTINGYLGLSESMREYVTNVSSPITPGPNDNFAKVPGFIDITSNYGMAFEKYLTVLLSMNAEFRDAISRTNLEVSEVTGVNDENPNAIKHKDYLKWYSVNATVEWGEFDNLRGEYSKTITLKPTLHMDFGRDHAVSVAEALENAKTQGTQISAIIEKMEVSKAYSWMFTGINDQVIDVDINYNPGLALLLPPSDGNTEGAAATMEEWMTSAEGVNQTEDNKQIGDENAAAKILFDQNLSPEQKVSGLQLLTDAQQQDLGERAGLSEEQTEAFVNNDDQTIAEAIVEAAVNNETAAGLADILTGKGNTEQEGVKTESGASTSNTSVQSNQTIFSEDLQSKAREEAITSEGLSDDSEGAKARIQENIDFTEESGTSVIDSIPDVPPQTLMFDYYETQVNRASSRARPNNLFGYLYMQKNMTDYLVRLEMTIRGDPWYLGEGYGAGDTSETPQVKQGQDQSDNSYNYIETNSRLNYFLFEFNSPKRFDLDIEDEDNNTGLFNPQTSYFLSGIYQYKQATLNFSRGVFTIDVQGAKETALKLSELERIGGTFTYIDSEDGNAYNRDLDIGGEDNSQSGVQTESDDSSQSGGDDGNPIQNEGNNDSNGDSGGGAFSDFLIDQGNEGFNREGNPVTGAGSDNPSKGDN